MFKWCRRRAVPGRGLGGLRRPLPVRSAPAGHPPTVGDICNSAAFVTVLTPYCNPYKPIHCKELQLQCQYNKICVTTYIINENILELVVLFP